MVCHYHLFQSFSQFIMVHTVKGFGVANETDVSLEFPNFLYDPVNVGILISGSSSFSKSGWDIWKFSDCIVLKPSMQDFKHGLTSVGNECNCPMVSTFFSIYSIYMHVCVCTDTHTELLYYTYEANTTL